MEAQVSTSVACTTWYLAVVRRTKLRPSSTTMCTSGRQYRLWLSPGYRSRMMVVAMMGLISTPVMSRLPDASARATSQPPPGPMIRVLAPGPHGVGQAGALFQQVVALARGEVVEIESGDIGGGVGVDDDGLAALGFLVHQRMREKVFHWTNLSSGMSSALGVANVEHVVALVVGDEGHQRQRQGHRGGASAHRSGQAVPDGRGGGEIDGGGQHRALAVE